MQKIRIYALMSSVGLESLFSQVLFLYIPLLFLFGGKSEFVSSFVRSLSYIAPIFLGYYIGSLVDIYDKRKSGFISALMISLFSLIFIFFELYNNLFATIIYLFVTSSLTYFLANLRFTLLPILFRSTNLPKANSLLLVIDNSSMIIAPFLASLLLKETTPKTGLYTISFLLFFSSFLYLYSLRGMENEINKNCQKNCLTFIETWRAFSKCKQLVVIVIATMGNNAFVGIFSFYIIVVSFKSHLVSRTEAPFLLIASGIGAIVAGLLSTKLLSKININLLILFCCLSLAICGICPVYLNSKFMFYLTSFCEGFFSSVLVICVWTLRQQIVSSDILGRVTGVTSSLFKISPVVCLPLSGLISDMYGPNLALFSSSFWIILFSLPLLWYLSVEPNSRDITV